MPSHGCFSTGLPNLDKLVLSLELDEEGPGKSNKLNLVPELPTGTSVTTARPSSSTRSKHGVKEDDVVLLTMDVYSNSSAPKDNSLKNGESMTMSPTASTSRFVGQKVSLVGQKGSERRSSPPMTHFRSPRCFGTNLIRD